MKSWRIIQKYLSLQVRITKEEAENETYLEIKEGTNFKGYNLWILGFALEKNRTARTKIQTAIV